MKTPFRLDEHPRRPQPLAPPPPDYFDRLPRRVMARVQPAPPPARPRWAWLTAPLRTALAAGVVLGGFAGSLLLSQQAQLPPVAANQPTATLAAVPRAELVQYLLAADQRLSLSDLAELPASTRALPETYFRASPEELQQALDSQPAEELYF